MSNLWLGTMKLMLVEIFLKKKTETQVELVQSICQKLWQILKVQFMSTTNWITSIKIIEDTSKVATTTSLLETTKRLTNSLIVILLSRLLTFGKIRNIHMPKENKLRVKYNLAPKIQLSHVDLLPNHSSTTLSSFSKRTRMVAMTHL